MVKMHKLTKGGQTIYPATIYDAVVNPKTRKSLATEISDLEKKTDKVYYHSIYEDDSIRSQEKRRINKIIKELYITPEKASIGTISLGNIRRNVTTSTGAGQWNVVLYDSSKSETTEVVSFSSINKKGSLELLEQDGNYCLIDWSEVDDGKTVIATTSSEYQLNISYISDINNFPIIKNHIEINNTVSAADKVYYHSIYEDDSIRSQEKRRINKIIKELYITPEKASIGTISLGNIRRNVTTSTGAGQWNVVLYDSSKSETTEVVSFSSINKKGSLELLEQDGNYCLIDWSEVDDGKTVIATTSSEYQLNISYISDINNFPIIALSTRQTIISLKDEYIKMYNTPAISWVDDDFNLTSVPKIKNICDEVGCKCDFGLIPEYTQGTGDYPIDSIYSFSEEQLELIKQYELEGFHMQIHPVHKGWYTSASAGTYQGRAWTEQSLIKTIRVFKDNSLLNDSCIIYPGGSSNFSDTVEMVKTWLEFGITAVGKYNVGIHNSYKLERYFIRISVSNTKTQIKAIIDEAVEKGAWLILGTHGYDFNDSGTIDEITPSLANLKEIIEYANSKINIKPIGEIYRLRKPMLDLFIE